VKYHYYLVKVVYVVNFTDELFAYYY